MMVHSIVRPLWFSHHAPLPQRCAVGIKSQNSNELFSSLGFFARANHLPHTLVHTFSHVIISDGFELQINMCVCNKIQILRHTTRHTHTHPAQKHTQTMMLICVLFRTFDILLLSSNLIKNHCWSVNTRDRVRRSFLSGILKIYFWVQTYTMWVECAKERTYTFAAFSRHENDDWDWSGKFFDLCGRNDGYVCAARVFGVEWVPVHGIKTNGNLRLWI